MAMLGQCVVMLPLPLHDYKGGVTVSMVYQFNVLQALKAKGYNPARLRKEKLLAEGVVQSLRGNKPISWSNIEKVCLLLECQPGDLLAIVPAPGVPASHGSQ